MTTRPKALLAYVAWRNQDTLGPPQRARLEERVELLAVEPLESFEGERARALLAQAEILLTGWGTQQIDAAVLDAAPNLKLIAHLAGSVKAFLAPEVWTRGVTVCNAVAANAQPVAEFALAAIVFANKRVLQLRDRYRQERRWLRPLTEFAPGLGNFEKTVGIVGASHTGRRLIELLEPFSFRILLYDPYARQEESARLGVRAVSLDELLAESDVVSLHAPENAQTYRMIDARRLASMKDGAILINTARGSLIDHAALIAELQTGRIDAVLDTTDPEPLAPESPLYTLPNVLLLPHIAGANGAERHRLSNAIIDEIDRYVRGEPLRHRVRASELERLA